MDRITVKKAIAERTHRVLGIPRKSVDCHRWDGSDTVDVTHVFLSVPIGEIPMDAIRKYLFYLDHVIGGYVSVWTAAQDARLVEIVIPPRS